MYSQEEIESNGIIKQCMELLEKQIRAYPLGVLMHSLREYIYDGSHDSTKVHPTKGVISSEPLGIVSFGCPWILLIAIAQKDSPKNNSLQKPGEKKFYEWSKTLEQLVDRLQNEAYHGRHLTIDFMEFPKKIKDWEIVDETLWKKDIAPFIPTSAHSRIKNTHAQGNFVRNPIFPIARSYKLTKLFIESLEVEVELQKNLTQYISDTFCGMSLETLHINLFRLSYIVCEQKGILPASKIDQHLQESPAKLIDAADQKQLHQIVSEIKQLLNILSTTFDEISTKYAKIKDALFQQKTMLVNDNPFFDKPIYQYQTVQNDETIYICPSITLFNLCLETILIHLVDEWREKLPKEEKSTVKNIGKSRELFLHERINYHKDLFVEGGIVSLDKKDEAQKYLKFEPKDHGSLSLADFIVETPENIVIIECKNSFGIWRPFYENNNKYYESLERIKEALDQCNKTQKMLKSERKTKPVFNIVLCNENVWIEGAIVGFILYLGQKYNASSDKVKELEIRPGNYSILSFAAFDFLLYTKTLDRFIRECRDNAKPFDFPIEDDAAYNQLIKALNNMFNYHGDISEPSLEYSRNILNEIIQKANDSIS